MPAKSGAKGRKIGRTERSPAHKRYNNEQRWIKNKARRIFKHMRKFPNYTPFNLSGVVRVALDRLNKF